MPYPRRSLSFALLPALLAAPALALGGDAPAAARPLRPNIVLILADDLDRTDLSRFPNLSRLRRESAELTEFTVADSWCCPSRATILRSQHVHSHNVRTNNPPEGGFEEFHARGHDRSTIGTWLQPAGYRTAFLGKFLNGYPTSAAPGYVPPGWDDWHVPAPRNMYKQRNYQLIEQGTRTNHKEHLDDVLTQKARTVIGSSVQPFFLYLAPIAPHLPATHAPRHANAFKKVRAPRPPSFNRAPAQNEPRWLRRMPKLNPKAISRIDQVYRDRLRSMLAVDDMVGSVMETLRATGKLSDTYIFFTSDNGFHLGQHRLWPGKTTPFEEDVRVPALVRGPGIRPGRIPALSGTIDLAPTFADLAGAPTPPFVEGRSLLPILRRQKVAWRRGMLIEFYAGHPGDKPEGPDCDTRTQQGCPLPPTYAALRTDRHTYVEYATGERQFYDRAKDPYQLRNQAATAPPYLHNWLARYRTCQAGACRRADQG
ncbi:sulfatase family protein [Actinomadura hibisca]|uniref:sulfatase family protein n=1 Tax=Actinomadura hibisca TaxID=68565 RepID=UPI0009FC2A8C|nr:sulfatase [Actinomadura hibisca]